MESARAAAVPDATAVGRTVPQGGEPVYRAGPTGADRGPRDNSLKLELATGSFALLPLAWREGQLGTGKMLANLGWVLLGNLIGSVIYGWLLSISLTMNGHVEPKDVAAKIIAVAELKTLGYAKFGFAGIVTVFVKAILCNWLVCQSHASASGARSRPTDDHSTT